MTGLVVGWMLGCGGRESSQSQGLDAAAPDATADHATRDVAVDDSPAGVDSGDAGASFTDAGTDAPQGSYCDGAISACLGFGVTCGSSNDCCSHACAGGLCTVSACTSDGLPCSAGLQCCGGACGPNGMCTPLNPYCKTLGNACVTGSDCCSARCASNVCAPSSFCGDFGEMCASATDCCAGGCGVMAGNSLGTCSALSQDYPQSADGLPCRGTPSADGGAPACGGSCASYSCAPYRPTGVLVCQRPSGCRPVSDACLEDRDCCGSLGSAGAKPSTPVTCAIMTPSAVGVCRNPVGCKPNGDVCKPSGGSICNLSSDCCAGNSATMDTCKPDRAGTPRCTGVQCLGPGQGCASSADCCNDAPCVPAAVAPGADGGVPPLVCYPSACVPAGGGCTTDGDCCGDIGCLIPLGSARGVCAACG